MELTVNEKEAPSDPMIAPGDILLIGDDYCIMTQYGGLIRLSDGSLILTAPGNPPLRESKLEITWNIQIKAIYDGGKSKAYLTLVRKV